MSSSHLECLSCGCSNSETEIEFNTYSRRSTPWVGQELISKPTSSEGLRIVCRGDSVPAARSLLPSKFCFIFEMSAKHSKGRKGKEKPVPSMRVREQQKTKQKKFKQEQALPALGGSRPSSQLLRTVRPSKY